MRHLPTLKVYDLERKRRWEGRKGGKKVEEGGGMRKMEEGRR